LRYNWGIVPDLDATSIIPQLHLNRSDWGTIEVQFEDFEVWGPLRYIPQFSLYSWGMIEVSEVLPQSYLNRTSIFPSFSEVLLRYNEVQLRTMRYGTNWMMRADELTIIINATSKNKAHNKFLIILVPRTNRSTRCYTSSSGSWSVGPHLLSLSPFAQSSACRWRLSSRSTCAMPFLFWLFIIPRTLSNR
jgi:hypothetical protein